MIVKPEVVKKSFAFSTTNNLPLYFVSAADGTNVVKVFREALNKAVEYKNDPNGGAFVHDVLDILNELN